MATKVIKCRRCGRRLRNPEGWNVVYNGGLIEGYLCPECQTNEESMEAQVNEALEDYSKMRTGGPREEVLDAIAVDLQERIQMAVRSRLETIAASEGGMSSDELVDDVVRRVQGGLPDHYSKGMKPGHMEQLLRRAAIDHISQLMGNSRDGDTE